VVGVHATPDSAQVVQVDLPVNRSMLPHVEDAVSQLRPVDDPTKAAVSIPILGAKPDPASVFVDPVSSPVINSGACSGTGTTFPLVVLLAHAKLESTLNAFRIGDRAHRFHGHTLHQKSEVAF
jgi:hypothetical protein